MITKVLKFLSEEQKAKVARIYQEDSLTDALYAILSDAIDAMPEPGEKPAEKPDPEGEEFYGIIVSESPRLTLTNVSRYCDEEWFAELQFRNVAGETAIARIPFRRIWERRATEDLFCRGFLPAVLGEYRPSTDAMRRIDDALMRAIYDLRAEREKLKPRRIDWNKG